MVVNAVNVNRAFSFLEVVLFMLHAIQLLLELKLVCDWVGNEYLLKRYPCFILPLHLAHVVVYVHC